MELNEAWEMVREALQFAVSCVDGDEDPLNEREAADGHQYVMRMLTAVGQSSLLTLDPARPAFMPMLESVRYLGASGPDIDYDVAMVEPGVRHRITGTRGGATFVGICIYGHAGERGATGIVDAVDVDDVVGADGRFTYEFEHPEAARVIVRQYFHDRSAQAHGSWTIERLDVPASTGGLRTDVGGGVPAATVPTVESMVGRIVNAAQSLRWNAQLNRLWTPELRETPNRFVRQTPQEIVAAVTNPDVVYATSWWRVPEGQALVIELVPPPTRYWALQLCDRWFQSYPDRRSNLNDRHVTAEADGSVRIVVADGDPGHPNWLDTSGHRTGVMFFRWLQADPEVLPTCRLVPVDELRTHGL